MPAQLRYRGRLDYSVLALPPTNATVLLTTKNTFAAAPVLLCRQHMQALHQQQGTPRYVVVNAGHANAATGAAGLADAQQSCQAWAEAMGCDVSSILPFSTGVIGERMPVATMVQAVPQLGEQLAPYCWHDFAKAIQTTDTTTKIVHRHYQGVDIIGVAKGSGMIEPNMATMLAFICTNAQLDAGQLDSIVRAANAQSFQCLSVDGDTSTNDCLLVSASQEVAIAVGDFASLLSECCQALCELIAVDGEGATRLVRVAVGNAEDTATARRIGKAIANSLLVKTAIFAGDANWGRLVMAIGKADAAVVAEQVDVAVNGVPIVKAGTRAAAYQEDDGMRAFAAKTIDIVVNVDNRRRNSIQATIYGCDLSHEYIRINAEYRS